MLSLCFGFLFQLQDKATLLTAERKKVTDLLTTISFLKSYLNSGSWDSLLVEHSPDLIIMVIFKRLSLNALSTLQGHEGGGGTG